MLFTYRIKVQKKRKVRKNKKVRKVTVQYQNFWNERTSFEIDIYYGKISERLTCRSNTIF